MNLVSLIQHAGTLLEFLLETALRSVAVACVGGVVIAAIAGKRTVLRLYIWTAVLFVALAMPLLSAFLPSVKVAVPAVRFAPTSRRTGSPMPSVAPPQLASAISTGSQPHLLTDSSLPMSSRVPTDRSDQGRHFIAETGSPASHAVAADSKTFLPGRLSIIVAAFLHTDWKIIFVIVYCGGVAILLIRLLTGLWWARRLVASSRRIYVKYFLRKDENEDARSRAIHALLVSISSEAGLHRPPLLTESSQLSVPATVGLRHPIILLPTGWRTWTDNKLQAVLAHEISHVARRDAWTQLLSLLHRVIFWFSPFSWWLNRRLIELAEQASDEAALAGGADRLFYAETLLGFFAQLQSVPGRVRWQTLSMANRDSGRGERRVDRILAWKGAMVTKKSLAIALMAFATPAVVVVASLHFFIAYAKTAPAEAAPATSPSVIAANNSAPPVRPAPSSDAEAQDGQGDNQSRETGTDEQDTYYSPDLRYVIMSSNSNDVSMSGNVEDLHHARALSKQIKGDFIWFEHNEKSYVITDPVFIQQARSLFAPQEELGRKQDQLGRQQDELGRQQDVVGEQMEKARVQVPDISPDLEHIRASLKELEASGATQSQLGRIQSQIGELQGRLGRLQSQIGSQQSEIGRQQGDLGRRQAELGRQQGELGLQQAEIARRASRELRRMFEDAISKGIAKPE